MNYHQLLSMTTHNTLINMTFETFISIIGRLCYVSAITTMVLGYVIPQRGMTELSPILFHCLLAKTIK